MNLTGTKVQETGQGADRMTMTLTQEETYYRWDTHGSK